MRGGHTQGLDCTLTKNQGTMEIEMLKTFSG